MQKEIKVKTHLLKCKNPITNLCKMCKDRNVQKLKCMKAINHKCWKSKLILIEDFWCLKSTWEGQKGNDVQAQCVKCEDKKCNNVQGWQKNISPKNTETKSQLDFQTQNSMTS